MPSNGLSSQLQADIVSDCEEHERQQRSRSDFRRCVVSNGFFVKFGSYGSLYPQYMTQEYISRLAGIDKSAPRIPMVCDFFTRGPQKAYLVMEYIELPPAPAPDLPQRVAQALQWLRDLRAPDNVTIGPLGGGRARHRLFKDYTAPLSFLSIQALEEYMNKALEWIPRKARPDPISISDEPLVFTQSDMYVDNFGVDNEGNTCLFDFEDVGLLPESFACYTIFSGNKPFTIEVAKHLDWPPSSTIHSMARIGGILWVLSDPTLGLGRNTWLKPLY